MRSKEKKMKKNDTFRKSSKNAQISTKNKQKQDLPASYYIGQNKRHKPMKDKDGNIIPM